MAEYVAVAEVINACGLEARGEPNLAPSDVLESWTAPGIGLDTDTQLIVDASDSIVAYAEFERTDTPTQIVFDGYVTPRERGVGLGTWILDWAEARAREVARAAPAGSPVRLLHFLWTQETQGAQLLGSRGYDVSRHFYQLIVELDPPPAAPIWPEGIYVRTFEPEDARALHAADEEAFRDHWGFVETPFELYSHFTLESEDFDPSLVFLAMDEQEIAGASVCEVDRPEDAAKGWVGRLLVRQPWRRKGIARALLLESFAAFRQRGYGRVGLGVDVENQTGALDLYLGAGMNVKSEAMCFEKELATAG